MRSGYPSYVHHLPFFCCCRGSEKKRMGHEDERVWERPVSGEAWEGAESERQKEEVKAVDARETTITDQR